MHIFRGLRPSIPTQFHKAYVTIGNFDGVHVGHQAILQQLRHHAEAAGKTVCVITFEPHPQEFFLQQNAPARLTNFREKMYALAQQGVDAVWVLPFNASLANLAPADFVNTLLIKTLPPSLIAVGKDFHFGRARAGDIHLLNALGNEHHFAVEIIETIQQKNERISSTRLRHLLKEGNFSEITPLLGRPFSMIGKVCYGDQRGRQIGFPTINIPLKRYVSPLRGVYVVRTHGLASTPWPGVANIGVRPTVCGQRELLEVHLLDFSDNCYGKEVTIEFCAKIRDEKRFNSFDELRTQIVQDTETARTWHRHHS